MICSRINQTCHNCEITLFDTNFFKNVLNYYYESGLTKFSGFIYIFHEFFIKHCLGCAVNNRIYVSEEFASKELIPVETTTIFEIVPLISKHNSKRRLGKINCMFKKILEVCQITQEERITELIKLSEKWKKILKKNEIGRKDLTLYLLALELTKKFNRNVIIITDDLPFYDFVRFNTIFKKIELGGEAYDCERVITISGVLYIYNLYRCCKIQEFESFYNFFLGKIEEFKKEKTRIKKKENIIETSKFFLKNRYFKGSDNQ